MKALSGCFRGVLFAAAEVIVLVVLYEAAEDGHMFENEQPKAKPQGKELQLTSAKTDQHAAKTKETSKETTIETTQLKHKKQNELVFAHGGKPTDV